MFSFAMLDSMTVDEFVCSKAVSPEVARELVETFNELSAKLKDRAADSYHEPDPTGYPI